jgi:ketosteroid isomerase-like protein
VARWPGGDVSAENVELIWSFQPGPEVDLVALFSDDRATARLAEALGHLVDPAFECALRFPGAAPTFYAGLDGLRACWLDWLAPWASYRTEIEELIDAGDQVVVVGRDYARRERGASEVRLTFAGVWTFRDGRPIRAEFYADRAEGLASAGLAE